jgi:ribosomal protein L37AE/L43A
LSLVEELGIDNLLEVLRGTFGLDGEVVISDYRIACPNPKHNDKNPSCYVLLKDRVDRSGRRIEAGTWSCFSCHAKGDILSLGKYVLKRKRSEVRKLLEPGNVDGQIAVLQRRLGSFLRTPEARMSPAEWERVWKRRPWLEKDARRLDSYEDGPKTYLLNRGFTVATIKRWGVRYVRQATVNTKKGTATIKNSIAIPICDREGTLICWCYRKIDESSNWPKYFYTHNSPRSHVWLGINHLDRTDHVVLVEGMLDAMWLDQSAIPAIAIGGSGVDVDRARSLTEFGRLTLFMDRDDAGQWAATSIGSVLWERMPVFVARYRKGWAGDDPQSLEPDELRYAVDHAIPFTAWQLRLKLARQIG